MNIEEEKEASRKRVENKRAEECAGRLLKTLPGGSTLQEYMVAGLERWPGMTTDQHAAISKEIRNHLEGETDVARSQIVELKIWLRTYIKKELEADPTLNLKAPATWTFATYAGVARVTYETFRTQYFYPIRDEVMDELGIAKPAPKKGQKGFKTTARQKSDEKKAKERKEKAEKAAEDLKANAEEAGKALVADLNKRAVEKAAEEGDLLDAFEKKKNGKPKREKRPHPLPLEKGEQGSSEPPTYPEVNPPQPPSDPQVTLEEPSLDNIEGEGEAALPPEGDRQQAAEDVAPDNFPFEHSTEVHETAHRELQEEIARNRLAFDLDDAEHEIEEELDIRGPEKGGESPTEEPCQHRTVNQRGKCSVCGEQLAEAPAPEKDRQKLREEYLRNRKFFGPEDLQRWLDEMKLQELVELRSTWICLLGDAHVPLTINAEERQVLIRLIGVPPIEEMREQIRKTMMENFEKSREDFPEPVLSLELASPSGDLHYSVMQDGSVTSEIVALDKNGFWGLQRFLSDLVPRLGDDDFAAPEDTEE